ncbi:MAG: pyruvate formate lyase family protein, partial [Chloroflexota bacterium]
MSAVLLNELSIPVSERAKRLRDELINTEAIMCAQRGLIVTDAYRRHESDPIVLRRAKALRRVLEEMGTVIGGAELIVGCPAERLRGASVFPEMSIQWVKDELDRFETRAHNRLKVLPEVREALEEIYPYWVGRTVADRLQSMRPAKVQVAIDTGLIANPHERNGLAHVALDFERVLREGLTGVRKEIEERLAALDPADPDDYEQRAFLLAAVEVCEGTVAFARRHAAHARRLAADEVDPGRRAELEHIAVVCERVPAEPARDFHEVLQSFWFAQLVPQIEANGFSITPGRFDQYMYPYLASDLESGRLSLAEAQDLLESLWVKFSHIIRVDEERAAEINAGYSVGQNLCVGGIDAEGRDATNLLSYMCLAANQHLQLPQPNFTVRLHKYTPEKFLGRVVESISGGNGMPQVLNDELIVSALLPYGFPLKEARDYIPVGCDEVNTLGTWGRCNGGYLSFAKALELALNDGRCAMTGRQVGPRTGKAADFHAFADLLAAFDRQMEHGVRMLGAEANLTDWVHAELVPYPSISILVPGCIENGKDVTRGGARRNFTGPVGVGSATAGDSLAAIKKLVFEEGRISLGELVEYLASDFAGAEDVRLLLTNKAPKFGNDDDYVDELVVHVTNKWFDEVAKLRNPRGGPMMPALYSVTAQVGAGMKVGATADGRKAGE